MMEVLDDQVFTEDDGSFGHHTLMHKDNSVTVAHKIVELAIVCGRFAYLSSNARLVHLYAGI